MSLFWTIIITLAAVLWLLCAVFAGFYLSDLTEDVDVLVILLALCPGLNLYLALRGANFGIIKKIKEDIKDKKK